MVEQAVFGGAQVDAFVVDDDLVPVEIYGEPIVDTQDGSGGWGWPFCTAENGRYPSNQFPWTEWLGHIIIGSQAEPLNFVVFITFYCEQNHGDCGNFAQQLERFKAVHLWHHHIHDDQIGCVLPNLLQSDQSIVGFDDLISFQLHVHANEAPHTRLIIHHQNEARGSWL